MRTFTSDTNPPKEIGCVQPFKLPEAIQTTSEERAGCLLQTPLTGKNKAAGPRAPCPVAVGQCQSHWCSSGCGEQAFTPRSGSFQPVRTHREVRSVCSGGGTSSLYFFGARALGTAVCSQGPEAVSAPRGFQELGGATRRLLAKPKALSPRPEETG